MSNSSRTGTMQRLRITIMMSICVSTLVGQSFYSNSVHFGLRNILLGGAVTAGNEDLSMVFYNPAALHMVGEEDIDVSFLTPQINIHNYGHFFHPDIRTLGVNLSLKSGLASYRMEINDSFDIVFTLFNKTSWNYDVNYRHDYNELQLHNVESFQYKYRGGEVWLGGGTSFKLSDNVHLGVGQYFSLLGFDYSYAIQKGIFDNESDEAVRYSSNNLKLNYDNTIGMVTKIGLQYILGEDRIGATLTTPTYLPLHESAAISFENIDVYAGTSDFQLISQTMSDIKFKNNWEINIGYMKTLPHRDKLWSNLMIIPPTGDYVVGYATTLDNKVVEWHYQSRNVVNISLGYSRFINDMIEVITSLRTDISSYRQYNHPEEKPSIIMLDRNRLHLTVGSNIDINKNSISLGIDWGISTLNSKELYAPFTDLNHFTLGDTRFAHHSIQLLMTYGFLF